MRKETNEIRILRRSVVSLRQRVERAKVEQYGAECRVRELADLLEGEEASLRQAIAKDAHEKKERRRIAREGRPR